MITPREDLTADRVRKVLRYDPSTGYFYRLDGRGTIGQRAGTSAHGYRRIGIDGFAYAAHRLAWLYVYGSWPNRILDHANRDRDDNRLENLRLAERGQNNANSVAMPFSAHGIKGVTLHRGKWQAQITKDGRNYYLGLFETAVEANAAYYRKAVEFFGDFARAA